MNDSTGVQPPERHIAHAKDIKIASLLNRHYSFNTKDEARKKLDRVLAKVIMSSKNLPYEGAEDCLWIKGFALSGEMRKTGYVGNFCQIKIEKNDNGDFTFYAEKYNVDLKFHPQKNQDKIDSRKNPGLKKAHPNGGHPLIRQIKKRRPYRSRGEAWELLYKLHREYPATTVPITNQSLGIQIFSGFNKSNPVKKYTMEIREEDGAFYIDMEEKTYQGVIEKIRFEDLNDYRIRIQKSPIVDLY